MLITQCTQVKLEEARDALQLSECFISRWTHADIWTNCFIRQLCFYQDMKSLQSFESAQEARDALSCASSNSYEYYLLSKLPTCRRQTRPVPRFDLLKAFGWLVGRKQRRRFKRRKQLERFNFSNISFFLTCCWIFITFFEKKAIVERFKKLSTS